MTEINDNYWYRQPWIWFIIALLGVTMIASFAILILASMNAPDLVVENYANIDELTTKTREQDAAANRLGLSAAVRLDGDAIAVELSSSEGSPLPASIIVYARNSTRPELDSRAELLGKEGFYAGAITLPDNAYNLYIEHPGGDWRLSKRLNGRPAYTELQPFRAGP